LLCLLGKGYATLAIDHWQKSPDALHGHVVCPVHSEPALTCLALLGVGSFWSAAVLRTRDVVGIVDQLVFPYVLKASKKKELPDSSEPIARSGGTCTRNAYESGTAF
jgi:hypothetical protein